MTDSIGKAFLDGRRMGNLPTRPDNLTVGNGNCRENPYAVARETLAPTVGPLRSFEGFVT